MVYSDHNPIVLETDLVLKQITTEEGSKRKILTEEGKEAYRKELEERKISQRWKDSSCIQETYNSWCKEVMEVKEKHEQTRKITRKRRSKTMRLLINEKKNIKEEMKGNRNDENIAKLKALKEKMKEEEEETYFRKLKKTCDEIKKDGKFNSGGFWKAKKRMEKKKEDGNHAVLNTKGDLVTSNESILEAYKEYYEDLLTMTNRRTKLPENADVVGKVEEKFNKIMETAQKQTPMQITEETVRNVLSTLKRKKARDNEGWNNEMLLDGGDEMVKSLVEMTNQFMKEYEIPEPWDHMIIKSIHKKGEKEDLTNKRGLFLTNIISKFFEKTIDQSCAVKFDRHQNGGQKRRGPADNWIILHAQIDESKRLRKPLYLFFADLVKCFDRLWLKDCLNDLYDCGMRERELGLIYKLNQKALFRVATPAGLTEEVEVEEIVKQGTVYGPKLCCASTGKINQGLDEIEVIYPNVSIQAMTYMDDIEGGGSAKFVKAVMENCRMKEIEKLWEFSEKKSKWMCISNRKKNTEDLEVEVRQGVLGKTDVYKLLGNMVNDKGNMDDQLKYMEGKLGGLIREGAKMCCGSRIGKWEMAAKKLIYEALIEQSAYYNIETWTNLRKTDTDRIKSIQGKILRGLFNLPKTTPYWGLINELDVMPIMMKLTYKKLMLFHNIMNSDDDRIVKGVIQEQEKSGIKECWVGNIIEEAGNLGIVVSGNIVKGMKKSTWKKVVKKKITEAVERELAKMKEESKKLRFLKTKGNNTYLLDTFNEDARMAIKIRTNMVEWIDDNIGVESSCPLCGKGGDTTEHVFACDEVENPEMVTVSDLENGAKMKEIVELFRRCEEERRRRYTDELQLNFDILRREGTL